MRYLHLLVALLTLAIFLPGAASAQDKAAKPKKITIAMIAKSSTNPVFLAARRGAEDAAKRLSEKYGVEVVIDWKTPPTEDGQVQAQRIEQAVNEGANAILLSASDAGKVTRVINDAAARGVPTFAFDSDVPQSKRIAYYGVDDKAVGALTMATLAKNINGKGRVAILAGNQNAPNLRKRVEGAVEEAKKYPGIEIANTFYHAETPQDAAAEVLRQMNADPGITAWAMIGGWPLFTTALLTQLDPAKVTIVAVDALPAELAYVDKGLAPALIAQPIYSWGEIPVEMIVENILNKKEIPARNVAEPIVVTKENLTEWAKKLESWGFTDVPKEYLGKK
jgi:ribose transport system substrate-binding protein